MQKLGANFYAKQNQEGENSRLHVPGYAHYQEQHVY
jgi:hypothetical protein